jgi:hypothetical protein
MDGMGLGCGLWVRPTDWVGQWVFGEGSMPMHLNFTLHLHLRILDEPERHESE